MGDSSANRPAPTANGTLAKTPLVHLLLYCLEKKLSGTLELLTPDKRNATIILVAGQPAKVRTSEPVAYLGRVLMELGHITEERLTRSLADLAKEKASGRKLHGEVLMSQGVLDGIKLRAGLREQVARKLRHLAGMPPDTAYGFYQGYDGLHAWGREATEGIDPLPVLWGMLREYPPWDHVTAALTRLGASPLRLRGSDLARLGLADDELKAVELMRARPLRPTELARAGQLNERTGQLLAYLLLVTKQVDVLPEDAASGPSRPPPSSGRAGAQRLARPPTPGIPFRPSKPPPTRSAVPPPKSPTAPPPVRSSMAPGVRITAPPAPASLPRELAERWREIGERAATIDRADYFGMLDVAKDATAEDVETAFVVLAKVWHPDRLPPELAPMRELCSRVFGRMSEARSTLVDPKQRERYLKLLAEGSGSPEMQETVARVVEAATHFQKAEVCFKRNDFAQAETFCRMALDLDDTQSDYLAMMAWLVALKPDNQTPAATAESIRMLDKAITMNPRSERGHFYRGMLYKRIGKKDLAQRDFREVAELNPRNIDAAREVRLHQMRGGSRKSDPPAPPPRDSNPEPTKADDGKPGLFGRLFKKS